MTDNRTLDTTLDRFLGPIPELPKPQGLSPDWRAAVALWTGALLLVLSVFNGGFRNPGDLVAAWQNVAGGSLERKLYWAGWQCICYGLGPLLVILLIFRESPARYGLRIHLNRRTALVYAVLVALVVPFVLLASTQPRFQAIYPFVAAAADDWQVFLIWECAYILQFVCLEFFFRGYLLFALQEKLGYLAIGVSVIPYGLIHIHKPFPEALAAIVAGTILGFVALRTRSVLGGILVHSTVAVLMDTIMVLRR